VKCYNKDDNYKQINKTNRTIYDFYCCIYRNNCNFCNSFLQQPQFGQPPSAKLKKEFLKSKNYNGKTFQNKDGITVHANFFTIMKLLPQWLNGKVEKVPSNKIQVVKINKDEFINFSDSLIRITWFGHSTVIIEIDGKKIMIDTMLGKSPSPVSFFSKRFFDGLPLEIKDIPTLDAVIISHDHYDHLDYLTILDIKDKVGHFYVPFGVGSHLVKWGVDESKITELDWWDEVEYKNMKFVCTPAQHFSGRSLNDRNKTLWCSWVIVGKSGKLFFCGDSGYSENFTKIGEKYGPFDLCMMECGQYNDLWKEIHILPEEAVQANIDLKGKVLMPIHWGAFSLSLHKWNEPVERLIKEAQIKNVIITTPMVGESIIIDQKYPNSKWW